jgi:uncharacterized membrane protein YfcA
MLALSLAIMASALAGFSRGLAAFGAAMIYIPLVTLAYDAKTAVVTIFLVDLVPSLPLIWKAAPQCDRRTVFWMTIGAVASSPVGVAFLVLADQRHIQFVMGLILIGAATYMLINRNFRMSASPVMSIGAGAVSGLAGGISGIFGPPAMIYLVGRSGDARTSRADTIIYLTVESIVLGITYLIYDMYRPWYFKLAIMLMPVYGFSMWCGANCFARISEVSYRRSILGLLWGISVFLLVRSILARST